VAVHIAETVPRSVEQVHARYIHMRDLETAAAISGLLAEGLDFAELAAAHSIDALTAQFGGDLGTFAMGTLLIPELEEAAFALSPGITSDIIAAEYDGETRYFIVETLEVIPMKELSNLEYSQKVSLEYEKWLGGLREEATISIVVDAP